MNSVASGMRTASRPAYISRPCAYWPKISELDDSFLAFVLTVSDFSSQNRVAAFHISLRSPQFLRVAPSSPMRVLREKNKFPRSPASTG